MTRRLVLSSLAAMAVLASGCSLSDGDVGATEPDDPAGPVEMTIAAAEVPAFVDPVQVNPLKAVDVMLANFLFDGLTTVGDEGEMEASIATSWNSEDGETWEFRLDDAATFSDGSPVTPTSVVESLERAKDADDSIPALSLGTVGDIEVLDEGTVKITTVAPNWELPKVLASPALGIVPADFDPLEPVTSGPFDVSTMGETGWSLRASDADAPADAVELVATRDDVDARTRVEQREADLAVVSDSGATIAEGIDSDVFASLTVYLGVRQGANELSDVEERAALMSVVDRDELVEGLNGDATPATALSPLSTVNSTCGVGCIRTDEASVEFEDPFVIDYLDADVMARIAGAVALGATERGVEMTTKGRTTDEMEDALAEPKESLVLFGAAGLSESPDSYLSAAFGSKGKLNVLGLTSNMIDDALASARATEDDGKRAEGFEAVDELVIGLRWAMPLVRVGKTILSRPDSPISADDVFGSQLLSR